MTGSIIINILLVIFLIVICIVVSYLLLLFVIFIISELSTCSSYIYEQFKKYCDSCNTFFKQEDHCAHCDKCCKTVVLSIQHTNEIINEECAICITDNNSNSISLNCNHTYHSKCIGPWIKQCNQIEQIPQCPLCKADIV
jgi:hypothetical protein